MATVATSDGVENPRPGVVIARAMPFSGQGLVLPSLQLAAFTDGSEKSGNPLMQRAFEEFPPGDGQNVSWAVPAGTDLGEEAGAGSVLHQMSTFVDQNSCQWQKNSALELEFRR